VFSYSDSVMQQLYVVIKTGVSFSCRCACKMKVAVSMILTVVIVTGNTASAQDVHSTSSRHQRYTDTEKQEERSESEDELFGNSLVEAIDNNAGEKPSLESGEIETDDDVETPAAEFEGAVADHDPDSELYDYDNLETEGKDIHRASQQPVTQFPPPFDHSTVDSSDIAQVSHFAVLIDSVGYHICIRI